MNITVILCSYNRWVSLGKTLDSLAASKFTEPIEWEVLVVDNNSTDQTRAVVEDFCRRHPGRFRYLFEPKQGLSYARNAGIRNARGDVMAFTDDDVTVDPSWLQNLTAPLGDGVWAGSGGRILPQQGFSFPQWLPVKDRYAFAPLALFDLGSEARRLTEPPFGASMAFQRRMFAQYGDFRTDLGRSGTSMLSNEDTELGRRVLAGGESLRYEPLAIVYHPVSEGRLRKTYFLSWWFDKARADIREFGVPLDTKWRLCGIPLYLLRRLAVWTLRWMVTVEPRQRFSCQLKIWSVAGTIVECFRQSRAPERFPA
jgi:glycosyltransferase involved in cell wall biosynthesis